MEENVLCVGGLGGAAAHARFGGRAAGFGGTRVGYIFCCFLGCLRLLKLHDYFYFREHLFIVTEKLGDNLYEFGERVRDMAEEAVLRGEMVGLKYFTLARVASVGRRDRAARGREPRRRTVRTWRRFRIGAACAARGCIG